MTGYLSNNLDNDIHNFSYCQGMFSLTLHPTIPSSITLKGMAYETLVRQGENVSNQTKKPSIEIHFVVKFAICLGLGKC